MPIAVTCPSCLTRFSVSEKFAGKSGPCPKCQKKIQIPEKGEEVVIHAPEDAGPKDSKGRAVLKPLRRKEVSLSVPVMLAAGLGTLMVFGVALGLGLGGSQPPTALLAVASILLAIPIAMVGYWFLHDDELEGYGGKELWVRAGICALGFAASWGVYAFTPAYVRGYDSMSEITGGEMVIFVALMIALGTAVSVLALELEVLQGLLHYMFYFSVTFVLAWLAGAQLSEPLSRPEKPQPVQNQTQTVGPSAAGDPGPVAPAPTAEEGKKPNLLQ